MNRVCLVGRLTTKPELRYTNSNLPFSRFSIAVNRTFSNSQGQREADFINIVVWRKQAENVCNFLDKGSLVSVEGRIQTGSYDGQDGNRRYTFEVVADSVQFLESRAKTQNREQNTMSDNVSPYDYQNDNSFTNNISVENDPFADFGDNVTITDDFLD
ncbi:MAG TPA: single-stranded DNA-binding protein [Candidatus Fimihabitans intestinipullorum]|uniref:Single-stranded DNA-binding protein n=1 Tax=Candidatus Fimihabitans intestinipullorum TaxID=2840820 RepID=A0A9D1L307_9BACT|nr:single-stranded DNA-binding protein [Candidatus Fimihabitans intestinipullorum]